MTTQLQSTWVWLNLLQDLMRQEPSVSPRGMLTRELIGHKTVIDMTDPIVMHPARDMGYKFMCAEAAWIMDGRNDVSGIKSFSKEISKFSDDGLRFFGAYGPRIVDQFSYIVDTLIKDPDSRQAVLTIWRPNPRETKDIPCTVSVQFLIRGDMIHVIDVMRSSDAWLGWVYDTFNFSMLAYALRAELRHRTGINYQIGTLSLFAGSQHLYERNFDAAKLCLEDIDEQVWAKPELSSGVDFDQVFQFEDSMADVALRLWSAAYDENGALEHLRNAS